MQNFTRLFLLKLSKSNLLKYLDMLGIRMNAHMVMRACYPWQTASIQGWKSNLLETNLYSLSSFGGYREKILNISLKQAILHIAPSS